MRLWSVQTEDVYDEVMKNGFCLVDMKKSECLYDDNGNLDKSFKRSYDWLVDKLISRIGKPDNNKVEYPWWAYYKLDDVRDLTLEELKCTVVPGKEYILLELEVPDEDVVLSDLDNWHFVLNNWWLDDSLSEEEWDKNQEWLKSLEYSERERVKSESWDKIFDITPFENEWRANGKSVQANFWVLKKEYIKGNQKFIGESMFDEEET